MRGTRVGANWPEILLATLRIAMAVAAVIVSAPPAIADDAMDAEQLVDRSRLAVESFMADPNMEAFRELLKRAKGVFIAPQVLKGAFVIGASGGSGVLLTRDEKTGGWGGPAFYTMGGLSFGLQAGGQASEVALLAMTERGVAAFQASSVKLGAEVGFAIGPLGAGAAAASANLSADIISYVRSGGLFVGMSVDGAVVATRDALNRAYYGKDVTPSDILIRREVRNPQANGLLELIAKAAATK
ncbi:MAG TPA: lipid-binding SYLF domain-containing protein [Candidatus Methylomirabilis sp.]|nr:lipid-binding SYLF domain-containing protein [Candidatus Methylomirabilis sp.]